MIVHSMKDLFNREIQIGDLAAFSKPCSYGSRYRPVALEKGVVQGFSRSGKSVRVAYVATRRTYLGVGRGSVEEQYFRLHWVKPSACVTLTPEGG